MPQERQEPVYGREADHAGDHRADQRQFPLAAFADEPATPAALHQ